MSKISNSSPFQKDTLNVEDLCVLANSFADGQHFEKAIQIYESACRIFPDNLALKINLGRVRNMRNQALDTPKDILKKDHPHRELWANRYQGLGEIYLRTGKKDVAQKVFELSKVSNPNFYLPYLNLGRLFLETGKPAEAIKELEGAYRLNPFNEEVVELLSTALASEREYSDALKYAVDALILSGEISQTHGGRHRAKIKSLIEKMAGVTPEMRNQIIHERRNRIQSLFEELQTEIDSILTSIAHETPKQENGSLPSPTPTTATPIADDLEREDRVYEIAAQLKKHLIFRNMDDAAVLKVARFSSERTVAMADFVYQEHDPIYGLYLVNRGKVELHKSTPFGPMIYATFERGSFFGDDNLLYGRERYTSAVAVQESHLIFIDKAGLATIFVREKEIAIHFLWYFWKSLSFQIRESNERMMSFFAGSPERVRQEISEVQGASGGRPTHVEIDKKIEVLQAQGLNTGELHLLAKFSNEEVYNKGETIFREGDIGDRLYIVLEGAVLISKHIAGTGEEALAVLRRGDFFGEMALIGNNHQRSADAKAQEQGTTVLVITNQALREILSIDTDSAYQLLRILCRILSRRLLEINEKLYQWKMMSGGFA